METARSAETVLVETACYHILTPNCIYKIRSIRTSLTKLDSDKNGTEKKNTAVFPTKLNVIIII